MRLFQIALAQLQEGYQALMQWLAPLGAQETAEEPMPEIEDLREPVADQTPAAEAQPSPAADQDATRAAEYGLRATEAIIAELKQLAAEVGEDAAADVQGMLDHFPHAMIRDRYQQVTPRLQRRRDQATQAQENAGEVS